MAIKKGTFLDYAKIQDIERQKRLERAKKSKYNHGMVFDKDEIAHKFVPNKSEQINFVEAEQVENKSGSNVRVNSTKSKPSKISKDPVVKPEQRIKKEKPLYNEFDINKNLLTIQGYQKSLFLGLLSRAMELQNDTLDKITMDKLIGMSNTNYQNTKLAISRLVNKGLLIRYKGKTSKTGYYSLGFSPMVFKIAKNIFTSINSNLNSNSSKEIEVIN